MPNLPPARKECESSQPDASAREKLSVRPDELSVNVINQTKPNQSQNPLTLALSPAGEKGQSQFLALLALGDRVAGRLD